MIIYLANIRFCLCHLEIFKFFFLSSGFILGLFSTLIKVTAYWPTWVSRGASLVGAKRRA